jgi:hypothetical protein
VLIDCGADKDFISPELTYSCSHLLKNLLSSLYVFDRMLSSSGLITYYTTTEIFFSDETCQTEDFLVFDIDPPTQIIFRLSWLMKYNPHIDWAACTLTLPSSTPMTLLKTLPLSQILTLTLPSGVDNLTASSDLIDDELTILKEYTPWAIHDPLMCTNSSEGWVAPASPESLFWTEENSATDPLPKPLSPAWASPATSKKPKTAKVMGNLLARTKAVATIQHLTSCRCFVYC